MANLETEDKFKSLLSKHEEMCNLLQELKEDVRRQEEERKWMSDSLSKLESAMTGHRKMSASVEEEFRNLCRDVSECFEKVLSLVQIGIFLSDDASHSLRLVYSLGYGSPERPDIKFGEGLVGRCALSKRLLTNELPADYFVSLSLAHIGSGTLVHVPLCCRVAGSGRTKVVGVIEMVVIRPLLNCESTFLKEASFRLADEFWNWRAKDREDSLHEKLREYETDYDALDSLPAAVVTIDQERTIRIFNAAAEKLWGYKFDDIMGEDVSMLFDSLVIGQDEFVKAFVTFDMSKIADGRREVSILNKSGKSVRVMVSLSATNVRKHADREVLLTALILPDEEELAR